MLEKKMQEPLNLKLSPKGNVFFSEDEALSLEKGVMFGGEHYGFNLLVEKDEEVIATPFGTQCSIVGVQINGDNLIILENNKYIPWRFNKITGELVNEAVFSFLKRTEKAYLEENFGIVDEEGLAKINGQSTKGL